MKKIALLIAALLFTAVASTAQNSSRWGITAGANFNELHFKQTDIVPAKRAWGPQVGLTGEMNFSGIGFGVDAGLLYTLKQGKINYGDRPMWAAVGAGNEMVSMHYLDVPLHLKFRWHRMGGFESTLMPLVYAGPQFSFLVGANNRQLNAYSPVSVYLDMGAGIEIMERCQLRAGYNFSIGQTLHTKHLDDNVAKNRTWYVNLTWFMK